LLIVSTSSFALSTRPAPTGSARNGGYDPKKKQGLLPASGAGAAPRGQDNGGGGATYVIGGNILNTRTEGGLRHHGDEHLGEKIGRRGAEKRKKKDEDRAAEESLKRLLGREGIQHSTGGKYLAQLGVEVGKGKGKGEREGEEKDEVSRAFSAKRIKAIGFDPTIGVGQRRPNDKAKRVSPSTSQKGHVLTSRPRLLRCSSDPIRGLDWVNLLEWVSRQSKRRRSCPSQDRQLRALPRTLPDRKRPTMRIWWISTEHIYVLLRLDDLECPMHVVTIEL
jgi:hypothetical protein